MMTKNLILAVLFIILPVGFLFAFGDPEEGDFQEVDGLKNWDHIIEISDYEEGKYNLIVRGIDNAGNITYEGPYNVFIDQESDLPIVHISNPTAGMRVGTNLNIIGTCVDDDAVKQVQISLNDGDYQTVKGTNFWSYLLNVEELPDGDHVISVRALDVNGNVGAPRSVSFRLDKKAPIAVVSSHESGAIVTDTINLEGIVDDKNGVKFLSVRSGVSENYEPVKLILNKGEQTYHFHLKIDTRKMEDGPQIFWFKAVDLAGSIGYSAFLLFVANAEPVLEILSPQEASVVNGKVLVNGTATDKIGVKRLAYQVGDMTGEVNLVPGNPYWIQEFDLTGIKGGNILITFTLENYIGNSQIKKLKLRIDPDSDMPQTDIRLPQMDGVIRGETEVIGFVNDDDSVKSILYSVDGGSPNQLSTENAVRFTLPDLAPGGHKLSVRAVDETNVHGDAQEVSFIQAGPPPEISLTQLVVEDTASPFYPGLSFPAEEKTKLLGEIRLSGNGGKAVYSVQGSAVKAVSLKKNEDPELRGFEITLSKELPGGKIDVFVQAADEFGSKQTLITYLFKGDPPAEPHLHFQDSRIGDDGAVRLKEGEILYGRVWGSDISSITVDPPTDLISVSYDGSLVVVEAVSPGAGSPVRINVHTAGGDLTSESFRFITDAEAPTLSLSSPRTGDWFSGTFLLEGSISDPGGIETVEYSIDETESFKSLKFTKAGNEYKFIENISLASVMDGNLILSVRAVDKGGNTVTERIPFQKDSQAPSIALISPAPDDPINGLITVVGRIEDDGEVLSVEFSDDGQNYRTVGTEKLFRFDLNLSQYETLPQKFTLKATDSAQNSSLFTPALNIDLLTDIPTVKVQIPAEGEVIRNSFNISGMTFDDDQIKNIFYRIDGGDFTEIAGSNSFSIPVAIDSITDNDHTVEVKATDINGAVSDTAMSTFYVSKSEPFSLLSSPKLDNTVRDIIELTGSSQDPNGIEAVYISFDNGYTFNKMQGSEEWSYCLDTRLLSDGTQALLVKAIDSTGTEGLYNTTINVDNQAPEITLDSPADGAVFTESVFVDGRAFDNIGLTTLKLTLSSIESPAQGENTPEVSQKSWKEYTIAGDGIFSEQIDVTELPPGWYNMELEALDKTNNSHIVSRNILLAETEEADRIELIFPSGGASLSGIFTIIGRIVSKSDPENVLVIMDGKTLSTTTVNASGYFQMEVSPQSLIDGEHSIAVETRINGDARLISEERTFTYSQTGPWIKITSIAPGDYVTGRPYLEGEAGNILPLVDESIPEEQKRIGELRKQSRVQRVDVSFDNGKSFRKAEGREQWRYRLETQAIPNGVLRVLVKATYENNSLAVTKTILEVDTRPPSIKLVSPDEGTRFNDEIRLMGTAKDENGLQEVMVSLRQGDKSRYGVPEFIQGLYFDTHTLGATLADFGLGLTFFDDNVKLQVQAGWSPEGRFSGYVFGAKLLANVAVMPFSFFFGPSWDFFSMAIAVGANFSYFTMGEDEGLVLGAIVAQWEFARFQVPDWRMFHTYSLYTEYQLWFISSDVEGGLQHRLSFGFRLGLF